MLEVKDLTVRYPNRSDPAIERVSFRVGSGEFVVLAGESASGKSTTMQAVCGFIPHIIPAELSGTITIDGIIIHEPAEIARQICMVQQDPESQFCTETVEEELAFGPENFCYPPDKIEHALRESLANVKASHLRHRTLASLSGGEKQKIAIAAMLALRPHVLILDEPTASLDPVSITEVLGAIGFLRAIKQYLTIIVVEHRIKSFIGLANRILWMRSGKLVADVKVDQAEYGPVKGALMKKIEYPKVDHETSGAKRVLTVRDLGYTVNGKTILVRVGFDVAAGSIVALMGRNGAGKTTLLRHIAGLQPIQTGTIEVFDKRMERGKTIEPWTLGREIGVVFQNPNHQIFEHTIEKELLFAPQNYKTDLASARDGIRAFTAAERVDEHLHPHAMSFGQKRRLNITSASLHGPRLILLDEPFAGQDATNALAITKLIARYQRGGRTFIIVTHDPDFATGFCTHAIVLDEGRVISAGGPAAVLKEPMVNRMLGNGEQGSGIRDQGFGPGTLGLGHAKQPPCEHGLPTAHAR